MSGEVLEYEAKTIRNEGIEQGLELGLEQGRGQGIEEGKIMGFVDACRDDGKNDQTIISKLILKYDLSTEEAEKYVLPASNTVV